MPAAVTRVTVGELRNLLAGLRCPVLCALPYPDRQEVEISTAFGRISEAACCYQLAVQIPDPLKQRRQRR